jgi:hypothetical protein
VHICRRFGPLRPVPHAEEFSRRGDKTSERLRGYALQGWFAADITGDPRRGVGGWSVDEIAAYLKTGHSGTRGTV